MSSVQSATEAMILGHLHAASKATDPFMTFGQLARSSGLSLRVAALPRALESLEASKLIESYGHQPRTWAIRFTGVPKDEPLPNGSADAPKWSPWYPVKTPAVLPWQLIGATALQARVFNAASAELIIDAVWAPFRGWLVQTRDGEKIAALRGNSAPVEPVAPIAVEPAKKRRAPSAARLAQKSRAPKRPARAKRQANRAP
jgi:hypothetical protein